MSNKLKWIWLAEKCGAGCREFTMLVERIGMADSVFDADYDDYLSAGVSERLAEALCDKRLDNAMKIMNYCSLSGTGLLCYDDSAYPVSLKTLKDPPILLYYSGTLPDLNKKLCVSMVGTRKMSEYGMRTAYKIAYEVAAAGAVVVSGMALGIDGIAACGAISGGGKTVAVLGCGIDIVYPPSHAKLRDIIKNNGAVITEYPPATEPRGYNFPMRNRIISGLGQGTVVIDADIDSGAMITAKKAILQGRDIYAVPGNIGGENTSGTNRLIRDGAQAVLCGRDIIGNYEYLFSHSIDTTRLTRAEKTSDIDPSAVANMGVSMRAFVPGKENKAPKQSRNAASPTPEKMNTAKTKNIEKSQSEAPSNGARTEPKRTDGDNSAKVLATLNEKQRRIFDEIPLDRAVTVDLLTKLGFSMGEVMSALTVLEIKGLISSLPGALYIRK